LSRSPAVLCLVVVFMNFLGAAATHAQGLCRSFRLSLPFGNPNIVFGSDVDISGDTIVVGAPGAFNLDYGYPTGAAFVFTRMANGTPSDLTDDTWAQTARLDPPAEFTYFPSQFGARVAVSGNIIAVVDPFGNGFLITGAIHLYERTQNEWEYSYSIYYLDEATIGNDELLGATVALDGTRLLIGATNNQEAGQGAGAGYILERTVDGKGLIQWVVRAKLLPPGKDNDFANMGWSVALNGDYAALGAPFNDNEFVNVYRRKGPTTWVHDARLQVGGNKLFGWSLALEGNQLLIGAPLESVAAENGGAVYAYRRMAGMSPPWVLGSPLLTVSDAASEDRLGIAVALKDGVATIGAPGDDSFSGSAYVFRSDGQGGWTRTDKLGTLLTPPSRFFGDKIAADGSFAVIGAPYDGLLGAAYVFALSDSDMDSVADACEGLRIGDEIPMPGDADGFQTSEAQRLGMNAVMPAGGAFYYQNVYPTAPTGRFFANQEGVVKIQWYDRNGAALREPVDYVIGPGAAVSDPMKPYKVTTVRYFLDYPAANVRIGSAGELIPRYNSSIREDYNPALPGNQKHLEVVAGALQVADTCPASTIIFQYNNGPNGRLLGFEVVRTIKFDAPPAVRSASIGRRLPTPNQEPHATYCRAVLAKNDSVNNVPVAFQHGVDSTRIYPIRDEANGLRFIVGWYLPTPFENCWPQEIAPYTTDWPADAQSYAVVASEADVPLADLHVGGEYCQAAIVYQKGLDAQPPGAEIINGVFKAEREGYSTLRLNKMPNRPGAQCGEEVFFEVIRSYDHRVPRSQFMGVYAGESTWTIGEQITDPEHDPDTALFRHGYLRAGQPYATAIYAETGQVIPVNSFVPHGALEVWWFRESLYAPGTHWPHKTALYQPNWPASRGATDELVIASRLGVGSYPSDSRIYEGGTPGSNPGTPGWNPNDEHALLLPIAGSLRAFAVRDDNPRGAQSGHPFVLVQYHPPSSMLWQMDVWRVVGERPPFDFDYDSFPAQTDPTRLVPVVAGQPIEPLFPVNANAAICRTDTVPSVPRTNVVGDALWVDRQGTVWAVEATQDGGTPGPSTGIVNLWENWAADGGCQPWRSRFAGGNGTQPWPIVFRPQWPVIPPACDRNSVPACFPIGQTVDVSGFCGRINVRHDSVGLRIIDPSYEVSVSYASLASDVDFAKLPPHLLAGQIGGGGDLVPDRIRYFNGTMFFRGVMSNRDREILRGLSLDGTYRARLDSLYTLSRAQVFAPLQNAVQKQVTVADVDVRPGWITMAFQNDQACISGPVSVPVWRVDCPPYQGKIQVIQPTCPFNEKQVLQFDGDAGGEPEKLVYQWQWSTSEDGPWNDYNPPEGPNCINPPTCTQGCSLALKNCYSNGVGLREVVIEGSSPFTLADSWWRVRTRGYRGCPNGNNPDPQTPWPLHLNTGGGTEISEWTEPQLAEGWVKRVVRGINPFDQRVADFHNTEAATYVSMIQQAGMRFEEPVALNCTPSNINRLGLIEVYETVLRRARQFSIDQGITYDPASLAILLVTGKIADLYQLLGHEAFADGADPTIGIFTDQGPPPPTYDPHAVFCFENQMPSMLEEELALLRGRDQIRPPDFTLDRRRVATVYNRLPWNFTSGNGQVAYANNYQVTRLTDIDPECGTPGHSSCDGARDLYPQGHGDAWGHYLTATKNFYALLRHPDFAWINSTEAVLVGGQPVDVGFEYERKFAQAGAAKARTGAAITSLTFRQLFSADPAEEGGYPDSNASRSWGVADWGRRAGMGAYFDWVTANAILDDVDDNPAHANTIKRIDRLTVPELAEMASSFREIQAVMDESDAGLNPLGLVLNVVPFGLSPSEIEQGKTHFDQIYERAVSALRGTVTAFDFANQNTQRLRSEQDASQQFGELAAERERDFNGRLVEIFGRPYPEDVGPGRSYPPGYEGPDIYHFAYVEPTELIGQTSQTRTVSISANFVERSVNPMNGEITMPSRQVTFNLSTDGLGLVKPGGWSTRPEPGEIQLARSELVQSLGRYKQAVERYEAHLTQIEDQIDFIESVHGIDRRRLEILRGFKQQRSLLADEVVSAEREELMFRRLAGIARAEADALAEALPRVVGFAVDATSIVRGTFKAMGTMLADLLELPADLAAVRMLRANEDQELLAAEQEIRITDLNAEQRTEELALTLRQLVRGAPALRTEVWTLHEGVSQATGRYQAAVGKGLRLLDERLAFRQKTATQVSEYRYRDMAFRIFRNQALQKYRAQFDLAAQYAYLAARAYDYETNLLGDDPEAGRRFLTALVKERVLGTLSGDHPMVGNGLAGQLAAMSANWLAIKPQLGFNAPTEINRTFSLRWELFRLPNSVQYDGEWKTRLSAFVVQDLNAVQEYTQYCQPLQPPVANNPAVVLSFSTTVQSQLNLFGWPSTGDATLPSDRFAIKLHSYGVRFSNYPGFPLNRQVNAYLVPVGADVMRVPACPIAPTRQWHLLDQTMPVPFPLSPGNLSDPEWLPWDSINGGPSALVRRRLIATVAACATNDETCMDVSFKLTGRSIWNTRWLLIIPGSELQGSDPSNGINVFLNGNTASGGGVRDIKLPIKSYGYSGCVFEFESEAEPDVILSPEGDE